MRKAAIRFSTGLVAAIWLATGGATSAADADGPGPDATALELIKEGNRYLSEEAQGRIMEIWSEKSVGSMTPSIWFLRYFDPDATSKTTEVKFGAGKKLAVKRPFRFGLSKRAELNRDKLKVDSNKAIEVATAEPLLGNLKLTATQLWLNAPDGPDNPVWKVRLWAEKLRDKTRSVNVGDIYVSAETGKVVRNDLHIGRVD